jgi:excisionase family DNA binding protein
MQGHIPYYESVSRLGGVTKMGKTERLTISVPEAGERLGIGRNSAYEAARRGEIPTIRIGGRVLVPRAQFERLLNGEAA